MQLPVLSIGKMTKGGTQLRVCGETQNTTNRSGIVIGFCEDTV